MYFPLVVVGSLLANAAPALAAPLSTERATLQKRWDYSKYFNLEGHRGARGQFVEATLPAFADALKSGVTTLELDVALTVDGELLVWHDEKVDPLKVSFATSCLAHLALADLRSTLHRRARAEVHRHDARYA